MAQGLIEKQDSAVVSSAIFSIIQWFPVWLNRSHAANPQPVVDAVLDVMLNGLAAQRHQFAEIDFPDLSHLDLDSFVECRRYPQICRKNNHNAHLLNMNESWPVKEPAIGIASRAGAANRHFVKNEFCSR
jgi:hypothetical protein